MNTKTILYALLFLTISFTAISQKKPAISNQIFKGLWILDNYESFDTLSEKWSTETGRIGYVGYILFDGEGHMAVQITPADYHEFDLGKKNDSIGKKVVTSYHGNNLIYFAEYKVEGNVINNKILSSTNPESVGAILIREFEIKGKTLLITPKNKLKGSQIRMKWVKVQ